MHVMYRERERERERFLLLEDTERHLAFNERMPALAAPRRSFLPEALERPFEANTNPKAPNASYGTSSMDPYIEKAFN